MDYLFIILSTLCIAFQFCLTKWYQSRAGSRAAVTLFFTMTAGLVSCLFFLCVNGFRMEFSPFSLVIALLFSVVTTLTGVLGILAVSCGKVSVFTMFMMLGGMLLPFLYGVLFLNETLNAFRIVGIILLVASLFAPLAGRRQEKGEGRSQKRFYLLCALVFLLNGAASILSKVHQIDPRGVDTLSYLSYNYASAFLLSGTALLVCSLLQRRRQAKRQPLSSPVCREAAAQAAVPGRKARLLCLSLIAAYALVSGAGYMLQLLGAAHLPASVLYPIVTGGTVVLSGIAGRIFFQEKLTPGILAGMALTLTATLLFLF